MQNSLIEYNKKSRISYYSDYYNQKVLKSIYKSVFVYILDHWYKLVDEIKD